MPDEVVPEVPVVETPKLETPEPVILSKREEIELSVVSKNAEVPEVEAEVVPEVKNPEPAAKPEEEILDPVERIKKSTQKRIDKLTAKSKSAEEELVEARAEIERLKNSPKEPEKQPDKNDAPPTPEQVEQYIAKCQEEGNWKEAAAATRYLVKIEKETAIREIEERSSKVQNQNQAETARQNTEMKALANDYVVLDDSGKPDITADMTLANQKGLLFKLATDYFNDKARHAERYNDNNIVNGFRRAVADAYRDISEHRRIERLTPKGEEPVRRTPKNAVLADPDASFSEDAPSQSTHTSTLSDADKVRAEIKARKTRR